jgi:hypothetical protein
LGDAPAVLFASHASGLAHGNFEAGSFTSVLANPSWRQRLDKPHQRPEALPTERRTSARELDSCNSSDALAMNVFCHPRVCESQAVADLLGFSRGDVPDFGVSAMVPLTSGNPDRTEIDVKIGRLLAECKLTEGDFTSCTDARLASYRDYRDVFETERLPRCSDGRVRGYQIIRNVLAAHASGSHFRLICDARRPDLLREYWSVALAVRLPELRLRCGFVLWQELAALAPEPLRQFLHEKYGFLAESAEAAPC